MASLNLSTNGASISKSYQSIINAQPPTGAAAQSPTYGQWALFSVSAPLANAFQQDTAGKESVLKVQSTGEGELVDLVEDFSDGRIQFAFVRVKDPNTTLPKFVLIGWCGEGVPERTKGYFTSHLAAVSKSLHGSHIQVTARSDRDLTPESIVQKVSDASGSKYSGDTSTASNNSPAPPISSKPAFNPTVRGAGGTGYNPLVSARSRQSVASAGKTDEDGWGEDAPPVTRTQLEKVQSSYQPTKVNLRELSAQHSEPSKFDTATKEDAADDRGVVRGGYQPVGKVDIAALRKQANQPGANDDRPTIVKGAYEPVGKVDIAAIRARAQKPAGSESSGPSAPQPANQRSDIQDNTRSLPDRSAPFSGSERLTSLPKPKVANRFGGGSVTATGTKAPVPGSFGLESKAIPTASPAGAGRTFADSAGKTPAQLWAEKKALERGNQGPSSSTLSANGPATDMAAQPSGSTQWKSGYEGKSWASVQTTHTGRSAANSGHDVAGDDHDTARQPPKSAGDASRENEGRGIPDSSAATGSTDPAAAAPPPLDTSRKPNAGQSLPIPSMPPKPSHSEDKSADESQPVLSPPPQPPRSPTPPTPPAVDSGSPIRIAMPVGRGNDQEVEDAREEQLSPPPAMPARSLAQAIPDESELTEEPSGHDPARGAGQAIAAASFGTAAAESAHPGAQQSGKRALVQYDYEKAEDNELELKEGEQVTDIEMVDENWWMGQNARGESGLFPSNYVELIEDDGQSEDPEPQHEETSAEHHHTEAPVGAAATADQGATATALYDYDAVEDNELSFPENATITSVEFPDENWWSGYYGGRQGLFPANYVQLDE